LPSEPTGDSQAFRFHFIGNNLTQLWLLVANGQIVILDIQTGKELKRLGLPKAVKPSNPVDQAFQTLGRNYLEDKKWVALSKHHYLEVNTTSFKAKYVDMSAEFDKYDISCMFPCFDKKYIYFYDSSWMGSRARGKVAVLDRKRLKIIWCWDMLQEIGTAPLHMEIIENQLFILDNALTLHLFE
jgi:rhodanese-related sulfurtransferase